MTRKGTLFLSLPSRRGLMGQGTSPLQVHRAEPYAPEGVLVVSKNNNQSNSLYRPCFILF